MQYPNGTSLECLNHTNANLYQSKSMSQTSNTNQNHVTKVTAMLTEILINDSEYQPTLQIIFQSTITK